MAQVLRDVAASAQRVQLHLEGEQVAAHEAHAPFGAGGGVVPGQFAQDFEVGLAQRVVALEQHGDEPARDPQGRGERLRDGAEQVTNRAVRHAGDGERHFVNVEPSRRPL